MSVVGRYDCGANGLRCRRLAWLRTRSAALRPSRAVVSLSRAHRPCRAASIQVVHTPTDEGSTSSRADVGDDGERQGDAEYRYEYGDDYDVVPGAVAGTRRRRTLWNRRPVIDQVIRLPFTTLAQSINRSINQSTSGLSGNRHCNDHISPISIYFVLVYNNICNRNDTLTGQLVSK